MDKYIPLARNPRFVYYIAGAAAGLTESSHYRANHILQSVGLQLIYIPSLLHGITKEVLLFNFPGTKPANGELTAEAFYKKTAESLEIDMKEDSSFLVSFCKKENRFIICDVTSHSEQQFIDAVFSYAENYSIERKEKETPIRYSITESEDWSATDRFMAKYRVNGPKTADERFEEDQEALVQQARKIIQKLLINGVSREVIQSWLYDDVIISNLKITSDFRIILPEYDDMEVRMTPLEKTVYLFFLKNPAGYTFKELYEHVEEIRNIYERLAKTDNTDEIMKSVLALTNPYDPSISEKCARIKAKFITLMPEVIAMNYYISGAQGSAKRIPLDREKVEWEAEI